MLARNTQLRGEFLSDRQVRRSKTVIYYIKCTVAVQVRSKVAGGIFDAISYHLAAEALAFVPQKRLIAAENSRAALLQTLENLQFGLADALTRAKKLDMRGADVGDNRQIRLGSRRHAGKLTEMVHAHLCYQHFGIPGHTHERQRQTDLIVQVAFCLLCAEAVRENGIQQLLGGGLADRPCYADDLAAAHRAVAACEVEQRLRGVLNVQRRHRIFLVFSMAHHGGRAVLDRLADEIVRVKPLALDRQEQRLRRDLPRIGRDRRQSRLTSRFAVCPCRRLR